MNLFRKRETDKQRDRKTEKDSEAETEHKNSLKGRGAPVLVPRVAVGFKPISCFTSPGSLGAY